MTLMRFNDINDSLLRFGLKAIKACCGKSNLRLINSFNRFNGLTGVNFREIS